MWPCMQAAVGILLGLAANVIAAACPIEPRADYRASVSAPPIESTMDESVLVSIAVHFAQATSAAWDRVGTASMPEPENARTLLEQVHPALFFELDFSGAADRTGRGARH